MAPIPYGGNVAVTGAAGFIGFHLSKRLLERGEAVVGLDEVNDYYDIGLKEARLSELNEVGYGEFAFHSPGASKTQIRSKSQF